MTEAEMLAEIERLREENQQLRAMTNSGTRVETFPDEIIEKYGSLKDVLWHDNHVARGYKKYKMDEQLGGALSKLIRATLFEKTKVQGKKGDKWVICRRMDDVQYEQYLDTLDDVLSVLSKHRQKITEGAKTCEM